MQMRKGMRWWGVRKGFTKVLFILALTFCCFFCICQRVSGAGVFETVLGNFFFSLMCVMVGNKYVSP
jgi:hypothetical protein